MWSEQRVDRPAAAAEATRTMKTANFNDMMGAGGFSCAGRTGDE